MDTQLIILLCTIITTITAIITVVITYRKPIKVDLFLGKFRLKQRSNTVIYFILPNFQKYDFIYVEIPLSISNSNKYTLDNLSLEFHCKNGKHNNLMYNRYITNDEDIQINYDSQNGNQYVHFPQYILEPHQSFDFLENFYFFNNSEFGNLPYGDFFKLCIHINHEGIKSKSKTKLLLYAFDLTGNAPRANLEKYTMDILRIFPKAFFWKKYYIFEYLSHSSMSDGKNIAVYKLCTGEPVEKSDI